MDPSHDQQPGFPLPEPRTEQGSAEAHPDNRPNTASIPEVQHNPSQAAPAVPPPTTFDDSASKPAADPTAIADANQTNAGLAADDSDLIEKEWVEKAKAIVDHTREDPFKQNQEINKVKAEYLKQRFNKDVKVVDK